MIDAGLYLIDGDGNFVYFIEIYSNSTFYSNQMISHPVHTSAEATTLGYTAPGGFVFPTSAKCPYILFNSTELYGMGTLLGFSPGLYPTGAETTTQSFLSNLTPLGSNVNSIILRSNIINNKLSSPSDILDSIAINSSFGSNINYTPNFQRWISLNQGTYNSIEISLSDNNFNTLPMTDSESVITLMIKQ